MHDPPPDPVGRTPVPNSDLIGFGLELSDEDWLQRLRQAEQPATGSLARPFGPLASVHASEHTSGVHTSATALIGRQVGHYRIVRLIDVGGMGAVYEARQERPSRAVALKLLKSGFATTATARRFEHETQLLARLNHPAIAQIYEAGTHQDAHGLFGPPGVPVAVPFFAMEYVIDASPITRYASAQHLSTRERISLFLPVCDAVHHGHQKGVIHRDLKPSNILVNAAGQPKVIDFGVARSIESDMTATALRTSVGQLIGTLQYMSPEQCTAGAIDIDTRSDVYSLGVVLYELLLEQVPYDVSSAHLLEATRIIREQGPARPSSIKSTLRGDLETILLKLLEKDRERRYQSAAELAADLRRYLAGDPIEAKRDHTFYILRQYVRRYRARLMVAMAFILLLAASSTVAWTLYVSARRDRATAERKTTEARAAERVADGARREATDRLFESYIAQARATRSSGRPGQRLDSLAALTKAAAIHATPEVRDEAIACMGQMDLRPIGEWTHDGQGVIGFSPDLDIAAFGADTGEITIHRTVDGGVIMRLPSVAVSCAHVQFDPTAKYLAALYHPPQDVDSMLIIWNLSTGSAVLRKADAVRSFAIDFSPDATLLAAGQPDGSACLYDVNSGHVEMQFPTDIQPTTVRFDPSGCSLAICSVKNRAVQVHDAHSGTLRHSFQFADGVRNVGWSPDGRTLAAGCDDCRIYLRDIAGEHDLRVLPGHKAAVVRVTFGNHSSDRLISFGWDGAARFWDVRTGRELLCIPCKDFGVSRDDHRCASLTGIAAPQITSWEIEESRELRILSAAAAERAVKGVELAPDGRLLAACVNGGVALWDIARCADVGFLPVPDLWTALFEPNREGGAQTSGALLTTSAAGLQIWSYRYNGLATPAEQSAVQFADPHTIGSSTSLNNASFARDGRRMAVVTGRNEVAVMDLDHPQASLRRLTHHNVLFVAISPNGKWVATGPWWGADVRLWDAETGALIQNLGHADAGRVFFSANGRWLAVSTERQLDLLETDSWTLRFRQPRNSGMPPGAVAFTWNGDVLAYARSTHDVQLIDLQRFRELGAIDSLDDQMLRALSFNPDGTTLIAASRFQIYLWNLRAIGEHLAEMGLPWGLSFSG